MQIDLPYELILRVQQSAALRNCVSDAEVIRKALDSLDWMDQERRAVQDGIDAWQKGDVQSLTHFDGDFRIRNRIQSVA